jgi:hypothetical protein
METKPVNKEKIHKLTSDILDASMLLESVQTAKKIEFITAIAAIMAVCMEEQEMNILTYGGLTITLDKTKH